MDPSGLSTLLANLPLLVALGAAVVLCSVLVARRKDLSSRLALGGFGGLFLTRAMTALTPSVATWLADARPSRNIPYILGAFTLTESTVAALAVSCLAGALWLGWHKRAEW